MYVPGCPLCQGIKEMKRKKLQSKKQTGEVVQDNILTQNNRILKGRTVAFVIGGSNKEFLTGAVKTMLLFPGSNVTSCTFSICAPSFTVTAGGLKQLGVSGGELLSWRRMTR